MTSWPQKRKRINLYDNIVAKTFEKEVCQIITFMRLCLRAIIAKQDSLFEDWHPSWHHNAVEFAELADMLIVVPEESHQS